MDLILGTAGHIDHGKTSLVRALTGVDCDRLEEEKRRGITIELGFAWLDLPDGRRLGIVDVPGHERFVKNMVAGASGVDCALLVIAADEGVMPQTREHLEICSLLGVRSGLVALTKVDLVDPEWLEMAREDIATALDGTFLEKAPVVPVSSVTGFGLRELREEIFNVIKSAVPAPKSDIFRLPADRVFTMKGFGTVVTGTVISGSVVSGEKLRVYPSEKSTRARSLEIHGNPADEARAGQRCAINLQNLAADEVCRGDVAARPDTLFPSQNWYIRLSCLKSSPLPIKQRTEVHFHHGAAERLAKIVFPDREKLAPGESAIAEVRFGEPMTAVYGDRCVIRSHSPLRVIGGGVVVNPIPPILRKRCADYFEKIAILEKLGAFDKSGTLLSLPARELANLVLKLYPAPGLSFAKLRVLTALPEKTLAKALAELARVGDAFCWDADANLWIGKDALTAALEKCAARAKELHEKNPLKDSFAPSALVSDDAPEKFVAKLLEIAVGKGILSQSGTGFKLASHIINLDAESAGILDVLLRKIRRGGWTPPFIKEIIEEQGWDAKKIRPLLNYLLADGKLLKIQDGVYYDPKAVAEITDKIRAWFAANDELHVSQVKTALGLSRKYSIPILEYLDSIHVTYRAGDKRRLSAG